MRSRRSRSPREAESRPQGARAGSGSRRLAGQAHVSIGSHSRSKKAKRRPSRHRLFATRMSRKNGKLALTVTGAGYCSLVADLGKRWPSLELNPKLPPKEGGLSIEGLSNTLKAGELLIGFRSPLIDEKALIVRLSNAARVLDSGGLRASANHCCSTSLGAESAASSSAGATTFRHSRGTSR